MAAKKKTTKKKTAKKKVTKKPAVKKRTTAKPAATQERAVLMLEVRKQLLPDPGNPRRTFNSASLKDLAADIKVRGVQQPIIVRPAGKNKTGVLEYIIVTGERRWRAAGMAGLKHIPALLETEHAELETPDLQRLLVQASENLSREDLNQMDLAHFLRRLRDEFKIPTKELPDMLEKAGLGSLARSTISNLIRLTDLPDWVQELVAGGKLTAYDARDLLCAADLPDVMARIKSQFDEELERLKNIDPAFREEYREEGIDMDYIDIGDAFSQAGYADIAHQWGDNARKYELTKENEKAVNARKVGYQVFALNKEAHEKLQAEAQSKAKDKGKAKGADNAGGASSASADNDKSAGPSGSKLQEYLFDAAKEGGYRHKPEDAGWLRRYLLTVFAGMPDGNGWEFDDLRFRLLLWSAFSAPEYGFMGPRSGYKAGRGAIEAAESFGAHNIDAFLNLGKAKTPGTLLHGAPAVLAQNLIASMSADSLLRLARHMKIDLDAVYRIDERYLAMHTGAALNALADEANLMAKYDTGAKVTEKRTWLLTQAETIGVPANIRGEWDRCMEGLAEEDAEHKQEMEEMQKEKEESEATE